MTEKKRRASTPCPHLLEKFLDRRPIHSASALTHSIRDAFSASGGAKSTKSMPNSASIVSMYLRGEKGELSAFREKIVPHANVLQNDADVPQSEYPSAEVPRPKTSASVSFDQAWLSSIDKKEVAKVVQTMSSSPNGKGMKGTVAMKPERFTVGGVKGGEVEPVVERSVSAEPRLMTPSERRREMEQELSLRRAQSEIRKSFGRRSKMERIVKYRYPHGVLGSEEPKAENTKVYEDKKSKLLFETQRKQTAAELRREKIAKSRDSEMGKKVLSYVSDSKGDPTLKSYDGGGKLFPKKATGTYPNKSSISLVDGEDIPVNPKRKQWLRQQDTRGRNYDFITGTALPKI